MRIPTAEFLAIFAATGQFSRPSESLSGVEFSLLGEPVCDRWYTVKSGDICDTIGAANNAPTYQIICQNDNIDAQCTNLVPGERICLGRKGEDCTVTGPVQWPRTSPEEIAEQYHIPLDVFEDNNYCYVGPDGQTICPPFHNGQTVCIARNRIGPFPRCGKIF